jgi:hypothetical protein
MTFWWNLLLKVSLNLGNIDYERKIFFLQKTNIKI